MYDGVLTTPNNLTDTGVECRSKHLTNFAVIFVDGDEAVSSQVSTKMVTRDTVLYFQSDLHLNRFKLLVLHLHGHSVKISAVKRNFVFYGRKLSDHMAMI